MTSYNTNMDNINATISFLKEALLEEPNNLQLRLKLASAYHEAKDVEKAKKQCQVVLQQQPDHAEANQLLALITAAGGTKDESSESPVGEATSEENPKAAAFKVAGDDEDDDVAKESMRSWFQKAKVTFEDVGGMAELKEEIKVGIVYPFEKPELYQKYGKKVGGGILLYGPPGCGKTFIAKATAGEINAMFIAVTIDDILDMWIGQSEKKMHRLFETARDLSPTVIFIDEVDALGADRMRVSRASSSLVNQMLTEMDGMTSDNHQVMVVGATNAPWSIDPAFRRPGRFDKIIFVAPPDMVARAEIFKLHLQNKPIEAIDYMELAKRTQHYSGADISKVCDMAVERVMRAVLAGGTERNVNMDDLLAAIAQTAATTKEWFQTAKNFARYANESETYSPLLKYMRENGLN
jgi:transitional endoplasmic reticulum ATPase